VTGDKKMKKKVVAQCVGIMKSIKIRRFFIVFVTAAFVILPVIASAEIYDIRQNFPKNNQGDNGIFLQYRNVSSSIYVDLNNYNPYGEPKPINPTDYIFVTPDRTDQDHYPVILGYPFNNPVPSQNQVSAAPSCTPRNTIDADAVMRITIPGHGGQVQITGSCNKDTQGNVFFTIYKGAENYSSPLWSSWNNGIIDITLPYSEGEQLFFATNTGGDGCPDLPYWTDLKLNVTSTITQIAIFRPSTGYWYFDYNIDGLVDKSFRYGGITDQIIKGDWQGTGKDGIAIFRPSTGFWYFDYNLDGIVDKSFRYGGITDRIISGDWNGDGSDGIAIFRNSTGYWYFDYNLDGIVDKSFRYGGSTDQIIAGKWA
jgi:hypothetical protein